MTQKRKLIKTLNPLLTVKPRDFYGRLKDRGCFLGNIATHVATFLFDSKDNSHLQSTKKSFVASILDAIWMGQYHPSKTGKALTIYDALRMFPKCIPRSVVPVTNQDTLQSILLRAVYMCRCEHILRKSFMDFIFQKDDVPFKSALVETKRSSQVDYKFTSIAVDYMEFPNISVKIDSCQLVVGGIELEFSSLERMLEYMTLALIQLTSTTEDSVLLPIETKWQPETKNFSRVVLCDPVLVEKLDIYNEVGIFDHIDWNQSQYDLVKKFFEDEVVIVNDIVKSLPETKQRQQMILQDLVEMETVEDGWDEYLNTCEPEPQWDDIVQEEDDEQPCYAWTGQSGLCRCCCDYY